MEERWDYSRHQFRPIEAFIVTPALQCEHIRNQTLTNETTPLKYPLTSWAWSNQQWVNKVTHIQNKAQFLIYWTTYGKVNMKYNFSPLFLSHFYMRKRTEVSSNKIGHINYTLYCRHTFNLCCISTPYSPEIKDVPRRSSVGEGECRPRSGCLGIREQLN